MLLSFTTKIKSQNQLLVFLHYYFQLKKNTEQMVVWTHGLIRSVPVLTCRLNIYLPSGDLYKRLQQNMLHFPFNSNVNLWVKIHLIYEEMFSWILIKLWSHLLFCGMQSSCFSIFEYNHCNRLKISMLKMFASFLTHSRVSFFCSKKEISIEPHVRLIKMIKLGTIFLKIDYSANFVRRNSSWGNK